MEILIFLSSGLFLGWSLGANDAANVFGTAVGTQMIRFRTAAIICSLFIVLGATISGAGAAHTLGRLGSVNALPGSFAVALAAALSTFWMTRLKLPVSTSQAIVGAIIGWNCYSHSVTDSSSLTRIVSTWVACPLLSAFVAVVLFVFVRWFIQTTKPHLLRLDAGTRAGLLVVGAFGSYSLGANNIANVMGVFVPDSPFTDLSILGIFTLTGTQQLFFLGAVAIAGGVFTYSERVMGTVGGGLARIQPVPALVVVLAQSITLFLFASEGLEHFLAGRGWPTLPLVPVSSSQAVVGAILGLSLFKGGPVRWKVLGGIGMGWMATPLVAGVLSILLLFGVENIFDQTVNREVRFRVDTEVLAAMGRDSLRSMVGKEYTNEQMFHQDLKKVGNLQGDDLAKALDLARLGDWEITVYIIAEELDQTWLTEEQVAALRVLKGRQYEHFWRLEEDLADVSEAWHALPDTRANKHANRELKRKLDYLRRLFVRESSSAEPS